MAACPTLRRCFLTAVLVLAVAAVPASADTIDAALGDAWVEVASPHFRIVSNASVGVATSFARRLENFEQFLGVACPGLRAVPALPVDVYVLRDTSLLNALKPEGVESLAGFATERPERNLVLMSAEAENTDKTTVLCHEFTHLFNRSNFPTLPLWLNEGLADYYGTFRLHGRNADFGHRRDPDVWWLNQLVPERGLIAFDVLFSFNTGARAYQKDAGNDMRIRLYSQGWLMTHWLLADPARAKLFGQFLEAIHSGTPPLVAWTENFPRESWPTIDAGVRQYLKDGFIDFRSIPFTPAASSAPTVRSMPPAAALAEIGGLLLDLYPTRHADALEMLDRAVKEDATLAMGWASLGRACDAAGDTARAEVCYLRAETAGPDDHRVALRIARGSLERVLRNRTADRAVRDAGLDRARTRFLRCLGQNHDDPEAQAGLAGCDLFQGRTSKGTVAMLATALAALPGRGDIADMLDGAREELKLKSAASPEAEAAKAAATSGKQ